MSALDDAWVQAGAGVTEAAHGAWHLVTRLGEAQILLPAMAAVLLWLAFAVRSRPQAAWWLGLTAVAALVTTATKVAFFGYEVGYAPLDYTGISGHAMFATAVLPVLARVSAGGLPSRARALATLAGYMLAAVIAYSRLRVGAHSAIEALAGVLMGSLVSATVLFAVRLPERRPPLWMGIGLLLWMLSLPVGAPPSPTHSWVVRLSLAISERPAPYQRWQMHRDHRREMKRRQLAQQQAAALR